MIPIEVLKRVKIIYCHGNCPDGMASAMLLRDAYMMLGLYPKIEFVTHNTEALKNAGYDVCGDPNCELSLFCDIAPHKEAAAALRGHAIVLDHHKGAEGETERLVKSFGEWGVFADEVLEPGVSGAVLAFREVWLPALTSQLGDESRATPVRDFAECCGVRDTWQTNDPRFLRGQWISKMLMSKPASWWLGDEDRFVEDRSYGFRPYLSEKEIETGRVLFEMHEEAVRQAAGQCIRFDVMADHKLAELFVFQEQATGFRLTSDVAELLRQEPTEGVRRVLAGFYYTKTDKKPQLTYSLRSIHGDINVAELAAFCGGGGHSKAAGFEAKPGKFSGDVTHAPYEYMLHALMLFLLKKDREKNA